MTTLNTRLGAAQVFKSKFKIKCSWLFIDSKEHLPEVSYRKCFTHPIQQKFINFFVKKINAPLNEFDRLRILTPVSNHAPK